MRSFFIGEYVYVRVSIGRFVDGDTDLRVDAW